ncbi:MAG: hypothetical protein JST80_01785 [Bdellovibrionales bacterium]|nr:hypothetical protein [Bdellovibrionales bacterium]
MLLKPALGVFVVFSVVVLVMTASACISPNSFQYDASTYGTTTGSGVGGTITARDIFQTQCYACHSPGGSFPDLTVNDQVLVGQGLVTPGDPSSSYLILKVEGLSGSIMPKAPYSPLSNAQIQVLKDWVNTL